MKWDLPMTTNTLYPAPKTVKNGQKLAGMKGGIIIAKEYKPEKWYKKYHGLKIYKKPELVQKYDRLEKEINTMLNHVQLMYNDLITLDETANLLSKISKELKKERMKKRLPEDLRWIAELE